MDRFYTQLDDISQEMYHYRDYFKDKVILCNCDDPIESKFFHYFSYQFERLGLKKLISTTYKSINPDSYSLHDSEKSLKLIYEGDKNKNRVPDKEEIEIINLAGDGDFRNSESIEILKECDIVVTNPPFTYFRQLISILIENDKKFIVIGQSNALTYQEIFPLFRDNKIWLGKSIHSGDREFQIPDDYPQIAAGSRTDETNGLRFIRVKGIRWFTNIDFKERHEDLVLYKKYSPEEYPKYDNYDAINVNRTNDIPCDYSGIMGVPITFSDKYNPDQFEILGLGASAGYNRDIIGLDLIGGGRDARPIVDGKNTFARLFIRRRL